MGSSILRLRVLIVNEDPFYGELLESLLRKMGQNTFLAATAEEAEALVEEYSCRKMQSFDMLITDFVVSGTDGLTLARKLAAIEADLFKVIISEDNSLEIRKLIAESGNIDGFVAKSGDIGDIKRFVDIALSTKIARLSGTESLYLKKIRGKQEPHGIE